MMKKYELTNDTVLLGNHILYRIRALIDIDNRVKKGELGGYIESESNLSHNGKCWIDGNAFVYENALIKDNCQVYDFAEIYGNALLENDVRIYEFAEIRDDVKIHNNVSIGGNVKLSGKVEIYDNARIDEN
ncbi:MAG: hypothetical protein HFG28_16215, partial [Eubacterium sp.]|nr:hypothetical protein [Eubacterium sp.]